MAQTVLIIILGHVNMVNLLIDNNANVNIASNDGSTPLHTAFVKGNFRIGF